MKEIIITKNKGYKWTIENNIYFKGYFILEKKKYNEKEAIKILSKIKNENEFEKLLKDINGSFAMIINNESYTYCAVDIARSMPLYYSKNGDVISDSGESIRKKLNIPKEKVDEHRLIEFFMKEFISGEKTTYKEIKQLDLGQYLIIKNNKINTKYYYRHYTEIINRNEEKSLDDLQIAVDKTFENLITAVDNRQIILSLSGGYDSRFIACTLKEKNIKNVICYTYGKSDSFEVKQSEKVAKQLGYKWINFEYTNEMTKDLINENKYFEYTNEHDYIIYLQNFAAVKKLKEMNICDKDAVFITGLCADMPTGFYAKDIESNNHTTKDLINNLYTYYFPRRKLKEEYEKYYKKEIEKEIKEIGIPCNSTQNYYRIFDCISTGYDHSRCFLNMNRIHEYFEHEWLIPCWDKNFLNYWYSLPVKYRQNQYLYQQYLFNRLYNKYNVADKKVLVSYSKNNNIKKIKYFIGGIAARIMYPLGITIKRNVDINNFAPFELELYKRIKNKSIIQYQRASLKQFLIIYLSEKRYGTTTIKNLKKYFN